MAIGAPDMGVAAHEGETGLTGVIELLRVPVRGGVTVATLLSLATFVSIIRCVAADTFPGYVPVFFTGVTCRTGCLCMLAGQCEGRLVMVEVSVLPGLCIVTGGAIRAQSSFVGVVLRMTATTPGRCVPIGHGGLVAALAGRSNVGVVECEVGEVVVEFNLAEAGDIRSAPPVLGVASAALTAAGLSHAPVIAASGMDIRSNFLVTRQALRALPLAVGEVVTVRAFGLDPGVRLGHRTGHDELLDAGCAGARAQQQGDRHKN